MSHSAGGVCTDATYKVNDYNINLITFMVLDDFQEGIPVASALSTREDKSSLVHILNAIKEICGPIEASWFMSDMAPQYFNEWKEVFGQKQTKYLWCAWHVDRAWKEGLKRYVKILKYKKKCILLPLSFTNGNKHSRVSKIINTAFNTD